MFRLIKKCHRITNNVYTTQAFEREYCTKFIIKISINPVKYINMIISTEYIVQTQCHVTSNYRLVNVLQKKNN